MTVLRQPPSVAIVVDDEADIRTLTRRLLERERWTVYEARNGFEALRLLEDHRDVVLLIADVNMPEINGVRVAEIAHRTRPDLKVLYITGYPDMIFDHGQVLPENEAYLAKPFSATALAQAASLLVFGTLTGPPSSPGDARRS